MKFIKILLCALVVLMASSFPAFADELDQGRSLYSSGDMVGAAEFFSRYAASHPKDDKLTPEALAMCARALDIAADNLTGEAEKGCYWKGGGGSPECMKKFAAQFNSRFGEGAFQYDHAITFIKYTGSHYRKILEQFPKSSYAPEAEFYILLHDLQGHPDAILPKIRIFLSKYPKGEWNRRGLLLLARVNEDIWFIHRKWSWVLFNYQISPEELIIRAEPYRQEALKTYEKLMKDKNTFEGKAAEREYQMLKDNKEDQVTYSVVNDSIPGTVGQWGIGK